MSNNTSTTQVIHSEEVYEIINYVPHWTIRWGITIILSLLLVLLLLSWLIKYPDTIQGQVILTTTKAPVRLCGQIHGTLRNICVANGASVAQGELIAEITNPISEHALAYLQEFLHEVQTNIDKPRKRGIVFTAMPVQNYIFGDIQEEYNNLCGLCQNYDRLVQSEQYKKKTQVINAQIASHHHLASAMKQQLAYIKKKLAHEQAKYDAYCKMYAQESIAKFELFDREACYLAVQKELAQQNQELIKNTITIQAYQLRLQELSFDHAETLRALKTAIGASVQSIKNRLHQWQQQYTLIAPLAGTVHYLHAFSEQYPVKVGEELFALVPQEEQYVAYMQAASQGYGKIKLGYKARIKLTPYPYQEYGYLPATVKELALLPNKTQYKVALKVDKRLVSTYGKTLSFKPEMHGWAEIITEDMSLLQRIMHNFWSLSKR